MNCSCKVCVNACHYTPGGFFPADLVKAASCLGLSVKEFFDEHCVIEMAMPDKNNDLTQPTYWIKPAYVGSVPGGMAAPDPRGKCELLSEDGLCRIQDGKPTECAWYDHTRSSDEIHLWRGKTLFSAWNTPEAQGMIRDLLGHEPVPIEMGFSALWSLL